MTITFESDKDVIVYALEKVISYARDHSYIFLAQSVWCISSVIGLQEGLVIHIDNLKARKKVNLVKESLNITEELLSTPIIHPSRIHQIQRSEDSYIESDTESNSTTETDIHNEFIKNCEIFLEQSQKERKTVGRLTRLDSRIIKKKTDRKAKRKSRKPIKTFGTQTEGIDGSELRRRIAAGECQRCAWPHDRKGSHKTVDCFRWKRLDKGTAPFPKRKGEELPKGLGSRAVQSTYT
jgi:hypothetical protein